MRFPTLLAAFVLVCAPCAFPAASPLQITEFAAASHQGLNDEDGDSPDWIEIQNVSTEPTNLNGWTVTDDFHRPERWRFPATNLPPGGFLVIFASGKDRRVPGRPLHTNFKLSAEGGGVLLRGPAGDVSKIENYPPQVAGVSFGLAASGGGGEGNQRVVIGLDSELRFYLAAPTPGRSNSSAISSGPRVLSVRHRPSPQQPTVEEPILVTAKIAALSGAVADVRLRYRVMFGSETELAMRDDGQHGDGVAGDGLYGATIPAQVATPGQMVRYCILAKDDAGRASRWPFFANPRDYSAYLGTVIADPSIRTRLPVVHLFSANDRQSEARGRRGGAIFYQGELYDNVETSIHGQISRGFPKTSYNLDFPRDHRFRYQTNRARVSDLTLLANFADKSKIRNTLAYEMIDASGSIGHFAFPIRIQRNGQFFSVAEAVEDGDDRWLERVGRDPGGALYKMYDNLSGTRGAKKKTRKREDMRDLAGLASALSEGRPLEERVAYAYDHIDIPQCVSYLVAMALISSGDHGHKNYYLYCDTRGSGEWALLPWDVDLSWGRNWTGEYFNETVFVDNPLNLYRAGRDKGRNRLYNVIFEHPEFRQMYLRRLRTVMDELLQPPGTPTQSLIIEKRVRELMDLLDPPGLKPSDAALDDAAWPSWGNRTSMRAEAQRIIEEHLPGRRNFLFKSSRAKLLGDPVPAAQPADVALQFHHIESRSPAAEQFVCITNQNHFAVDVTGWRLAGAGIEHRFRPGTVIPAGKAIYAVSDIIGFRRRSAGPGGGQSLHAQGNWKGDLQSGQGDLQLIDAKGRIVDRRTVP